MITRFEVENFKNFNNKMVIDFTDTREYHFNERCVKDGLLNKIIIYGKNGTGKTNLGYAIMDISSHLTDNHVSHGVYDYYLNADSDQRYARFKYDFLFGDTEISYRYAKINNKQLVYEELYFNRDKVFSYNFNSHKGEFPGLDQIGAGTLNFEFKDNRLSVLRYIANNSILQDDSPIKQMMDFVSHMLMFKSLAQNMFLGYQNNIDNVTEYVIENDLVSDFEQFLNKNGVDMSLIVKVEPTGEKAMYQKYKKPIPFERAASQGTIALTIFYYWAKQFTDVSFLFIDEFDAFYHFELAANIVEILESNPNFQTVVTSHNTNLLSNRIMRPDCYFIMTKNKITSLVNATDRELREGHNLEKLFKSGEFYG